MPVDALANAQLSANPTSTGVAGQMKRAAERGDDEALAKAAHSFEAYFVQEMLGSMRSTVEVASSDLFDSSASDTWTEQFDAEVAKNVASGEGLGLATMIINTMNAQAAYTIPAHEAGHSSVAPAAQEIPRDGWRWPLGEAGSVSSGFGARRHPVDGVHRAHKGLDIAAPEGTPILAARAGTVTHAGPRGSYGLLVEIEHADGIVTRYAHQSAIDVAVGQEVDAGTPIGAVGSTGLSTGAHLHLEVRQDGKAVDPASLLDAANH